ncbi:protein-glutamate O-methyltransferase [Aquamicrobium zhengzhouense]|uniref:Chemotaxis protein methyltransferase n=1 Tax=Aquamicrobium zhengzhouense TaxID=2781738 RepID=A0ABS0SIE9_9HYPH|nr:protein-glutamate O-methyltransferase [Aquamicrobium zhengzhouense]MBI1622307.1 protein-glutamate O-methyltransferase [Aquamicrobium zhengzhouense]
MTITTRPGASGRKKALVEGEFLFTNDDFLSIARMLYDDAGIALSESKASLVYSRLAKRLRALGLESFRDYCSYVAGSEGAGERMNMLAALTTNVTRFFREPHHFDHLRTKVLPSLVQKARAGGRVRFWSAGCSTGQEPFSIALTVLQLMPEAADYDVRILATDIDPNVVATGRAGVYSDEAVQPVPASLRDRWMVRVKDHGRDAWGVCEEMRRLVAFRELNLMAQWPMKGKFDAIFCRNVVIYFDEPTQARIWARFAPLLQPGGRLYVGHSERVTDMTKFENDGLTTYRLKDGF